MLLKLLAFSALAHLLGAGIGRSSSSGGETRVVQVQVASQYSDFLRASQSGQVQHVQLDGKGLAWRTRDAAVIKTLPKAALGAAPQGSAPAVEVTQTWYTAMRPDDAPVPYNELLAGGASFHAVSRARRFNLLDALHVVVRPRFPALGATRAAAREATTDLRCFLALRLVAAALTRLAAGFGAVGDADGVCGDWARHAQPDGHVQEPRHGAEQARQARGA
jgi:hypothetical protein